MKEKLCKGWKYQKCRIMGVDYPPRSSEAKDRFSFYEDMTFTMIEEGKEKAGTWQIVDVAEQVLSLAFEDGPTKELRIETLSTNHFVYDVVVDWQHSVKIYMTAIGDDLPSLQSFHFTGNHGDGSTSLGNLLFRP